MSLSNTTVRIIVAVIAIPVIVFVSYIGSYYFFVFTLAIGIISFYEFWLFVRKKEIDANLFLGIFFVILLITNNFRNFVDFYALILSVVLLLTVVELFRKKGSAIVNLGTTLFGILYIGLFASSLVSIREFYPVEYSFEEEDWILLGDTTPYPGRYKLRNFKYVNCRPSNSPDSYPTGSSLALVQYGFLKHVNTDCKFPGKI